MSGACTRVRDRRLVLTVGAALAGIAMQAGSAAAQDRVVDNPRLLGAPVEQGPQTASLKATASVLAITGTEPID